MAMHIANGQQNAKSHTLFRHFAKALTDITITDDRIDILLGRRAYNSFLLNAAYDETDV